MSHKSGTTKEQNTSPRKIRVTENTLTFLGPAFYVDHTWTDRSGLMVLQGESVATLMDYYVHGSLGENHLTGGKTRVTTFH